MDKFVFSIPRKQQQSGLKTNQTKVHGQSNATIGRDAATC
jgi:hypothetical protein